MVALMLISVMPAMPGAGAPVYDIVLNSPDGGEDLVQGQVYNITWTISGVGGYIAIYYSLNSGSDWTRIETRSNTITFLPKYAWTVPFGLDSTKCRVMLVWVETLAKDAVIFDQDESASDFTIRPGLVIGFRDVPSDMTYGKYYAITWDLFDTARTVAGLDMELRVRTGTTWGSWELPSARYSEIPVEMPYHYFSPPQYRDAKGQLRLIARESYPAGPVVDMVYSPEFNITSANVTLVYPNGGEALVAGQTYEILWRVVRDPGELISGAGLSYSTNGGTDWFYILASTENDYSHNWTVPTGGSTDRLLVKVTIYYEEFRVLGEDESDGLCRIIPGGAATPLSVTLLDPNPPATGNFMQGGTRYTIRWTATGQADEMTGFELHYSTNSGAGWNRIDQTAKTVRTYSWLVPAIDTDRARIKVVLVGTEGSLSAVSNNDFIIFTTASFNRPPWALAGPDQRGREFERITLDGTGSTDPDGDALSYSWTVIQNGSFDLVLNDASTATPWFEVDIRDYAYTFVFELEVDDGGDTWPDWLFYTDRVSVTVEPAPPGITSFSPALGWAGTSVTVEGVNCAGNTLYIGNVSAATFPTLYADGDPFEFTIHAGIPTGRYPLVLRSLAGENTTTDEFEVFPAPEWVWEHGLGFFNPADEFLSYPWDFTAARGNYRTTFGDVIYIPIWICIGIPWYDPWNGLVCLGYEIEAPSGIPDPLAALYYGCFYCWIGRMGQCFGMSTVALQFMNGDLNVRDFNDSTIRVNQLVQGDNQLDHLVESMQGAQLSLEVLDHYLYEYMRGLLPSDSFLNTGMARFLNQVEDAIDGGELGLITMTYGGSGHAVVPYAIEEVDDRTVRIYVYDCNREYFSFSNESDIPTRYIPPWNHPPYIEVEKTRPYWTWRYEWSDTETWEDTVGIVFCPYSLLNGPRTLPTDWEGLISFLAGDATSSIVDESGNEMRWLSNGTLLNEMEGAAPAPNFQGLGDSLYGWLMEGPRNFTTRVAGTRSGGVYNWSVFAKGASAFAVELAEAGATTEDDIAIEYDDDNPLRGRLTYSTTDAHKAFSATHVKRMGDEPDRPRTRVYRVTDATLFGDSELVMNTTYDYGALVVENRGPHPFTFDVELQTNVWGSDTWNASGQPNDHLPTAQKEGVRIEPYQILTIRPSNWLDLDHATINVSASMPDVIPPGQVASFIAQARQGKVHMTWTEPNSDGGSPITSYVLLRGPTYADVSPYHNFAPDERAWVDTDVELGKTYFYVLYAQNKAGDGQRSAAVGVWVSQGPGLPDMPRALNATVSPGQVRLSWEPPEYDGGAAITGYIISRSEDLVASTPPVLARVGTVLTYVDKAVEANTTYYYFLQAVNQVGQGPYLGPVEATVPPASGDGGDGDGDGDGDGGLGTLPVLVVVLVVVFVLAVGAGVFMGKRPK